MEFEAQGGGTLWAAPTDADMLAWYLWDDSGTDRWRTYDGSGFHTITGSTHPGYNKRVAMFLGWQSDGTTRVKWSAEDGTTGDSGWQSTTHTNQPDGFTLGGNRVGDNPFQMKMFEVFGYYKNYVINDIIINIGLDYLRWKWDINW